MNMLTTAQRKAATLIEKSSAPVELLVQLARNAVRANDTGRPWRFLPEDVARLVEAHGVADARFYAAELIVWHRGWTVAEVERIAAAREVQA